MQGQEPILFARMQGQLKPMTDANLLAYFIRMPMTPVKVMGAIHWQALHLMIKKIPYFKKREFPDLQRDYYEHKDYSRHVT